jgi:serine/threonine protein kinase
VFCVLFVCFVCLFVLIHRELPPHPNVVQLFGVSLDGPQPVIIMEYCSGGNQIVMNPFFLWILFFCQMNDDIERD